MSVPQTREAIGGPDFAVIELRLIGYTADLGHLVLVEEGANHERFRLVVEPDLFATLDEVRRRRREADLPVGDMAEFADRFGIDRETLEALLEERDAAEPIDLDAGDGTGGAGTDEPSSPPADAERDGTGREESGEESGESEEEPISPEAPVGAPGEDDGESVVRVLDQEEAARRRREARREAERAEEAGVDEPAEESEPLFEQRAWGAWSVPVRESPGPDVGSGQPEGTAREEPDDAGDREQAPTPAGEDVAPVESGGAVSVPAEEPQAAVPADAPDRDGASGTAPRPEPDDQLDDQPDGQPGDQPGADRPGDSQVGEVPVAGVPDAGVPVRDVGVGRVSSRSGGAPPGGGGGAEESSAPTRTGRRRPPRSSTPVSRLTPAQIQARLRAGHGVEEVAEEAGTERSWIERWLVPIEAERSRILNEARGQRLEHSDLGTSDAPLGEAVRENLGHIDVDASSITWEVARRSKGSWRVIVRYVQGERERQATWLYDPGEHTLNPASPEAREVGFTRHAGEG